MKIKHPLQFLSCWYRQSTIWRSIWYRFVCQINAEHFLTIDLNWTFYGTREWRIIDTNNKLASFKEWIFKIDWGRFSWYFERSFWLRKRWVTIQNANKFSSFRWSDNELSDTLWHWWRLKFNINKGFCTFKTVSCWNNNSWSLNSEISLRNRHFRLGVRINRSFLTYFLNSASISCWFLSVMDELKLMSLLGAKVCFKIECPWWCGGWSCKFKRVNKISEFWWFNCDFRCLLFRKQRSENYFKTKLRFCRNREIVWRHVNDITFD